VRAFKAVILHTNFPIVSGIPSSKSTSPPYSPCVETSAPTSSPNASQNQGEEAIITIGSLLSFQGGITVPAYAASKGGVAQLTKALSNEWAGKRINVNAIAPGYINTDMNSALMADEERQKSILSRIPAGRWGRPEDFKGAAVYLASSASGYVSGEVLSVDGGWMAR